MKRYKILFILVLAIFMMFPFRINATTTSVPGAEGHILTDIVTETFEGGYDSTIIVYITPNVSDDIKYIINDNAGFFAVPTYDSANWYFDGWKTWYKGSHSGLGVITSDKANPTYDDNNNYFTLNLNGGIVDGILFPVGSMDVLKEDLWKGTYYLSAIFKPILTVNAGAGISYSISGGSKVTNDKYAVTYGSGASINYSITDNKYMVTGVSASYGTSYSNSNEIVTVNSMERPVTITIQTQLKPQATYTAPTAKKLTYNKQQQELVNKGTSSEGTLMYSLEKDGIYSENVPMAKDAGDYTVWYYVKGDNNHNDSDKQSVNVTISQLIIDVGTVTVVFDANGGAFKKDVKTIEIEDIINFNYETFEKPNREGYKFIGFYTKDGKSYYEIMNSEAGIEEETTFYAKWELAEEVPKTLDNIIISIICGTISLIGLVGMTIYLKKRSKLRA